MTVRRIGVGSLVRVYIDTSVVVALSNPEDNFHDSSVTFVRRLQNHAISSSIGPPFLLEVGKAAEEKGTQAALRLVSIIEEYQIDLRRTLDDQLWRLSSEYGSLGVLGRKRTMDLLHYASATLLGCTHLASWDRSSVNLSAHDTFSYLSSLKDREDTEDTDRKRAGDQSSTAILRARPEHYPFA